MNKALLEMAELGVEPNAKRGFLTVLYGLWELLACVLWGIGGIVRKMWSNKVLFAEFGFAAIAVTVLIMWLNLMAAIS